MSVPGKWQLHYDFGCSGNYAQTEIDFNTNNTFSIPAFAEHGVWSSHDGQMLFQFDGQVGQHQTTYGGAVVDSAMVGIISVFNGTDGCWYAVRSTATIRAVAEHKPKLSPSGKTGK